jgi:hypothetical protein
LSQPAGIYAIRKKPGDSRVSLFSEDEEIAQTARKKLREMTPGYRARHGLCEQGADAREFYAAFRQPASSPDDTKNNAR